LSKIAKAEDLGGQAGYRPCVGVMLLSARREVLVAKRIDMPSEAWQMPQGGIDMGETPTEAAKRELLEEIGTDKLALLGEVPGWLSYDLPPELAGMIWGGKFKGQTQKWFAAAFLGQDEDINLETETPEFSAWQWVAPERTVDLIVPFKRDLYGEVLRLLRPYWAPRPLVD